MRLLQKCHSQHLHSLEVQDDHNAAQSDALMTPTGQYEYLCSWSDGVE